MSNVINNNTSIALHFDGDVLRRLEALENGNKKLESENKKLKNQVKIMDKDMKMIKAWVQRQPGAASFLDSLDHHNENRLDDDDDNDERSDATERWSNAAKSPPQRHPLRSILKVEGRSTLETESPTAREESEPTSQSTIGIEFSQNST